MKRRDVFVDIVIDLLPIVSLIAVAFGLPALLWVSYQVWGSTGTAIVAVAACLIAGCARAISAHRESR